MFKFLFYSAILYTVYSYFARLARIGRNQDERPRTQQKQRNPPKKHPDEEYVDYEEIK